MHTLSVWSLVSQEIAPRPHMLAGDVSHHALLMLAIYRWLTPRHFDCDPTLLIKMSVNNNVSFACGELVKSAEIWTMQAYTVDKESGVVRPNVLGMAPDVLVTVSNFIRTL